MDYSKEDLLCIIEAQNKAIEGLLRTRDFLSLQLDEAWGNLTKEEFDRAAEEYLSDAKESPTEEDLKHIKWLKTQREIGLDEIDGMLGIEGTDWDWVSVLC